MADVLALHDITASCRLGVYEWEQKTPQDVWVDLELAIDAAAAAASDDVADAVDYAALVKAVIDEAGRAPCRLLETLAERIAARVIKESGTARVRVRVKKKAMPEIGYAAVEIERRARPVRSRPGSASTRGRRRGRASADR